jgi:hypothetical protein
VVDDFSIPVKPPPISKYDTKVQSKDEHEHKELEHKENTIDDDSPDLEKFDEMEYKKERLHCWVLLKKGERQQKETFFIEPTTGRQYMVEDAPYQRIEGIFNHKNFWINLAPERPLSQINIEFDDQTEWEYVMIQPGDKKADAGEDGGEDGGEEDDHESDDEDEEGGDEILDMPPPWAPKLTISKDRYLDLCPNGEKTVFFKKCKVDFYADCSQVDGLVKRITIYQDYKRHIINEIRCFYKNRRDKLVMRRRFPYDFKLIEHFAPSEKTNYWKKLIQIDGRNRKIYFYHHRNKDGLIYREEMIGKKTIEKFKDREDRLIQRTITFDPAKKADLRDLTINDNHCGESVILKMTQKYELDNNKPAEDQISKTEFNLHKKRVNIYYHYSEGKITAKEKTYNRDDLIGKARVGDMNEKETEENAQQQEHKFIIDMERECH